jgi:hypothetical protein
VIQATLNFEPGLTAQFPRLRDLLVAVVYGSRRSLQGVAADLDLSPSELSRMLNREQDDPRKLDVEDLVRIIESTGDARPVHWLIDKFLRDPEQRKAEATEQLARLAPMLLELAHQAGITSGKRKP